MALFYVLVLIFCLGGLMMLMPGGWVMGIFVAVVVLIVGATSSRK
jgi:hypothetical protein